MASSLRERKKQATRDKIIIEGRLLFNQRGFEHTSIDDICEKVMISKATFYNYFDSKGKLMVAMFETDFADFVNILKENPRMDPVEKMKMVYLTILDASIGFKNMVGMSYVMIVRDTEFAIIIEKFKKTIRKIIKNAKKDGFAPNFNLDQILLLLNSLFYGIIIETEQKEYKEVFLSMFDTLFME